MNWGGRLVLALALSAVLAPVAGCTTSGPATTAEPTAPAPTSSAPGPTPPRMAPPTTPPTAAPGPYHYVFPVGGKASYAHTHHDYPASDIIAACGLPARAATDGVVLEISRLDRWDPKTNLGADRGGLSVSILGDDGVRYYGSHLSAIADGLDAGSRVAAGDEVGKVGDTGDAGACHLHFGISPPCARTGDWAVRRGEVWPWSYLDSWRAGGAKSPVTAVATWLSAHHCG